MLACIDVRIKFFPLYQVVQAVIMPYACGYIILKKEKKIKKLNIKYGYFFEENIIKHTT